LLRLRLLQEHLEIDLSAEGFDFEAKYPRESIPLPATISFKKPRRKKTQTLWFYSPICL